MVYVLVPLLLRRNVGVLFGVLKGPRSDVPLFLAFYGLYRCDVQLFPVCRVMRHCFGALL
jgi:hypothetical protein